MVCRSKLEEGGLAFLRIELETGSTFIDLARTAGKDQAKMDRNRANGRKAYDTIQRLLPRITLTTAEQAEFDGKLAVMKAALTALGEVFA